MRSSGNVAYEAVGGGKVASTFMKRATGRTSVTVGLDRQSIVTAISPRLARNARAFSQSRLHRRWFWRASSSKPSQPRWLAEFVVMASLVSLVRVPPGRLVFLQSPSFRLSLHIDGRGLHRRAPRCDLQRGPQRDRREIPRERREGFHRK